MCDFCEEKKVNNDECYLNSRNEKWNGTLSVLSDLTTQLHVQCLERAFVIFYDFLVKQRHLASSQFIFISRILSHIMWKSRLDKILCKCEVPQILWFLIKAISFSIFTAKISALRASRLDTEAKKHFCYSFALILQAIDYLFKRF